MGVGLEEVTDAAAEDARAMTVDYADAGEAGEEGAVEIFLQLSGGFVDGAAAVSYTHLDVYKRQGVICG